MSIVSRLLAGAYEAQVLDNDAMRLLREIDERVTALKQILGRQDDLRRAMEIELNDVTQPRERR